MRVSIGVMLLAWTVSGIWSLAAAEAPIVTCNGVVTNRPCKNGKVVLLGGTSTPPTPTEVEKKRKRELLTGLETRRYRMRAKYTFDIEMGFVREVCTNDPLKACQKAVKEKEQEMARLMADAVKAQKKREAQETRQVPPGSGDVSITINQDLSRWDSGPPRRYGSYPDWRYPDARYPESGRYPDESPSGRPLGPSDGAPRQPSGWNPFPGSGGSLGALDGRANQ